MHRSRVFRCFERRKTLFCKIRFSYKNVGHSWLLSCERECAWARVCMRVRVAAYTCPHAFTDQGGVLLTVGRSYVGNYVTHSTLLDRACACSYKNLPKSRSYRVRNTGPWSLLISLQAGFPEIDRRLQKTDSVHAERCNLEFKRDWIWMSRTSEQVPNQCQTRPSVSDSVPSQTNAIRKLVPETRCPREGILSARTRAVTNWRRVRCGERATSERMTVKTRRV